MRGGVNPMNVVIRLMQPRDIPDGLRLKELAGWNQTEHDWRRFIEMSPEGCFVAEVDGYVVGTVTTVAYENRVSWIGMMLVDPDYRRRGIASLLMNRAIEHLKGKGTIKLDATPQGREVYERLGFHEEYGLVRMLAENPLISSEGDGKISPVSEGSLDVILRFDREAFGADRGEIISSLWKQKADIAWKYETDTGLSGYCFGRNGAKFTQIGPLVAESAEIALALLKKAIASSGPGAYVIDVPDVQHSFVDAVGKAGFEVQRSLYRMFLGENTFPGNPDLTYAIAGPELG